LRPFFSIQIKYSTLEDQAALEIPMVFDETLVAGPEESVEEKKM